MGQRSHLSGLRLVLCVAAVTVVDEGHLGMESSRQEGYVLDVCVWYGARYNRIPCKCCSGPLSGREKGKKVLWRR